MHVSIVSPQFGVLHIGFISDFLWKGEGLLVSHLTFYEIIKPVMCQKHFAS